ncbi:MAG: glycosyltransferase [Kiritimatiellae bacterium]|nr:glycosyltransferase [Kiritimatiellia bacterium]
MKILLICNELGYRGTPRFLVNCAKIAKSAGHDVAVWAMETGGLAADQCLKHNIPVFIGLNYLTAVKEFNPKIVHIHRGGGASQRENNILWELKKHCRARIIETNVFGIADLTTPSPIDVHAHISRWDLWRWRRWLYPIHRTGIYLPYCVDTESFKPTPSNFRDEYKIPSDAIVIGRLGKTDWITLSNAVVPAIEKSKNIFFVTVNDYSDNIDITNDWPSSIKERIIRIPTLKGVEELSAFYTACDATLNFSPIGESFGYVVAEAMSCGTPCIALSKPRNDNAQIEIASLKFGGYPVRDSSAAEKTITGLALNPPTENQKRRCRESIIDRYSIKNFAPVLLMAYKLLAGSDKTGKDLEKIFETNGFETRISNSEIKNSLKNVIGGAPDLSTRLSMNLAYSLPNALRLHWQTRHSS